MENQNINWKWLNILYKYNAYTLISTGTAMILFPDLFKSILGIPKQDPFFFGVISCVWFTFGLLSALGIKSPLKFIPVLMMQLCYKTIWLTFIALPTFISGFHPFYSVLLIICMLSYVILDVIAIPFGYLFAEETHTDNMTGAVRSQHLY